MLVLFNIAAIAIVAGAWVEGYIQPLFAPDKSILTWVIAGVWLIGMVQSFRKRWISVINISEALVMLGLIGTVFGFIVALSGVDPDKAGDVSQVSGMVSRLIEGMGIALWTTLEGSVLSLWLAINQQLSDD